MDWSVLLVVFLGALFILVFLRIPVAYAIFVVSLGFALVLYGTDQAANQLVIGSVSSVSTFTLVPVPLFILLGALLTESGMADNAIRVLDGMFGKIRARLPILSVTAGGMLGILSGSPMATTAVLGKSILPKMMKARYSPTLAVGGILGSGGLSMVLPPSSLAVVLGAIGGISIGALFIGGIVPGLLMIASYFVIIILWARIFGGAPDSGVEASAKGSVQQRIREAAIHLLPLSLIVFLVLGLIILGVATPTESAALGVTGAAVLGLFFMRGRTGFMGKALYGSAKMTAAIFVILMASSLYSQLLSFSGASRGLVEWLTGLEVNAYVILLMMQLAVLLLGMFLDQVSILLVTLPLYMPVVESFGWDPVWFGILMLVNIQIAGTSPPFGLNLFVMKSVAPRGISMAHIYKGALPFIISDLFVMLAIVVFPALAIWLPQVLL